MSLPHNLKFNCFTLSQYLSTTLNFSYHFLTMNISKLFWEYQQHFDPHLKKIPSCEQSNTWSSACQHQHPESYQDHYLWEMFQLIHPTWKLHFLREKKKFHKQGDNPAMWHVKYNKKCSKLPDINRLFFFKVHAFEMYFCSD